MEDLEKKFKEVLHNLERTNKAHDELMRRMSKLEAEQNKLIPNLEQEFLKATQIPLTHRLADGVDSVVGLKEVITSKDRWLKWIWAIALCAGIVATTWFIYSSTAEYLAEPTATKVTIATQENYDYPPIFLCPNTWLNATNALSLGFSMEALKYSFGYINTFDKIVKPDNNAVARDEFLAAFKRNNFTSLNDYLSAISLNVPIVETAEQQVAALWSTNVYCSSCADSTFLSKAVINGYVCYKLLLRPEDSRLSGISQYVSFKLENQAMELISSYSWYLYINSNPSLRQADVPEMIVQPFTFASIRIKTQTISSLNTRENPCMPGEDAPANYSVGECVADCVCPLYRTIANCTPFAVTTKNCDYHPRDLCNIADSPLSYSATKDSIANATKAVGSSKEADVCYKKCQHACERTTYETIHQQDLGLAVFPSVADQLIVQWQLSNFSALVLSVENAAFELGGIVTWKEINTISLTTLISNIGGALGLFVGGTIMTLFQLALVFLKFGFDKRKKMLIKNVVVASTSRV